MSNYEIADDFYRDGYVNGVNDALEKVKKFLLPSTIKDIKDELEYYRKWENGNE